ncbi:MAG: hypothetical protein DLM69_11300 [Candidatus Chloroheliales bacterium]|nr:MAG: hypothetical protein DLM69_11300 [Chloroflexota bacterium]
MSDSNAPYSPDQASDADDRPTYANEALTGQSGYGAGAAGSINQGSERTGVSTGPGYKSGNAEDNATMSGGAAQNDARDLGNAEAASQALGSSGEGARYSEANATAGELTNSDQGYASGYAGSSGADEARDFRTSSDPEYGERGMGYDDDSGNA